jgi:acetyl esterase/lipase
MSDAEITYAALRQGRESMAIRKSLFGSRKSHVIIGPLLVVCATGMSAISLRADGLTGTVPESVPGFVVEEYLNIVYRSFEKSEFAPIGNRLDLYLPKDLKNFPVLFLVHGGAWVGGDKKMAAFTPSVARAFARQGLGVVAVNYRLFPWVKHPTPVVEVAKAFAWTQRHIAEYGGRVDEIFLMGHSAGGHIVTLLATDDKYARQEGADISRIQGVIALSGVYILSDVYLRISAQSPKGRWELSLSANPYVLVFGKNSETRDQASPLAHLRPGLPPFLLIYAEHDLPTLTQMTLLFEAALREQGCDVRLFKAAERNHATEWWNARKPDDPVTRTIMEFIAAHRRL